MSIFNKAINKFDMSASIQINSRTDMPEKVSAVGVLVYQLYELTEDEVRIVEGK